MVTGEIKFGRKEMEVRFQTQGKAGEVLLTEHRLYTKDIQLHRIGES